MHNPREGKIHVALKNPCLIILLFVDISAGSNFMIARQRLQIEIGEGRRRDRTNDMERTRGSVSE